MGTGARGTSEPHKGYGLEKSVGGGFSAKQTSTKNEGTPATISETKKQQGTSSSKETGIRNEAGR